MIRHIIVLRHRDGFTPEENRENARKIQRELDRLKDVIPGIVEFTVHIDPLPTSNADLLIDSLFVSEEALAAYQVHPEHVRAAEYIWSVMKDRTCIDYAL